MSIRLTVWRLLVLALLSLFCLQFYFAARILVMRYVYPESTAFQRAQMYELLGRGELHWNQEGVSGAKIHDNLRRAVIASEDADFVNHTGVEWEAIEKARQRNEIMQAKNDAKLKRDPDAKVRPLKLVGGSTITQQLAKNLFLSGERSMVRKGQELILTYMLEAILGKERILDIYLNSVEWGSGVFGAQAAAQYYFKVDAVKLSAQQAARLAVMLPAPRRFEKTPQSPYLRKRSNTILRRMGDATLPEDGS